MVLAENCKEKLIIGIDASRNRSGGAKAHIIGILSEVDPHKHGIKEVHVWACKAILDALPKQPWLVTHNTLALEQSLLKQVWWQATKLKGEANEVGCKIMFSTDASTVCLFRPMVVMSRDMLSYEPGIMKKYGYGPARLRLIAILLLQNMAFRRSDGVIFLTRYSADIIQRSCGILTRIAYIPHGVGRSFKQSKQIHAWPDSGERAIRCLYVSPVWKFKNQWVVVRGIKLLRKRGYDVMLTLVGGGAGKPQRLLEKQIQFCDPENSFIRQMGFVPHLELLNYLEEADIFVFASSCENMPNSLMEAMAVGLPIACSNQGPMPEILCDAGVFFNPEDAGSIADAIENIIKDPELRWSILQRAKAIAKMYSWSRCGQETFAFIVDTYDKYRKPG